ncbi:MAG: lipopolysaccharide biosynthesis protein [Candidatus Hydrogenedentes bacterium]|nr:lipopolysaccharide biosynthesis protein [Candidatus Hydrogenedentota bacterium]
MASIIKNNPSNDLKGDSIRGGFYTFVSQGTKFLVNIASTMILARLLLPSDFGLIAMVTSFTGFFALLTDASLSIATIQRPDITHSQISALFWINVLLSIILTIAMCALGPLIAWLYGQTQLVGITVALSFTFIMTGLTIQHQALLQRNMRFKILAGIDIISLICGNAFAIVLAQYDCGYWSLLGGTFVTTIVNCSLAWAYSGWRPGPPNFQESIRPMLCFGGTLTGFNILTYLVRNSDNVIIGYTNGDLALGIYSKAYNLLMMPVRQFATPVGNVLLPTLSALQNDPVRFQNVYLKAIGMLALVGMSLVAYLFVVANEAVLIVLGPNWMSAADVFRWLAPAAWIGVLNVAPMCLCNSLGKAKIPLVWAAVATPLQIIAMLLGSLWGATGVAAALSITTCPLILIFIAIACIGSPVSFKQVVAWLAPICIASSGSSCLVLILIWFSGLSNATILVRIFLYSAAYWLLYFLILSAFRQGRVQIHSFIHDGVLTLLYKKNGFAASRRTL